MAASTCTIVLVKFLFHFAHPFCAAIVKLTGYVIHGVHKAASIPIVAAARAHEVGAHSSLRLTTLVLVPAPCQLVYKMSNTGSHMMKKQ